MGVSAVPPERPMIIWEPTGNAPAGYIKANGATISRTAYAWLFLRIGTTFGAGDGSTTFKIPDLRGEFLRGLDDGRGVDAGRVLGSSQSYATETHTHNMALPWAPGETQTSATIGLGQDGAASNRNMSTGANTGSGGSETRPRNVAGLYCIAIAP